ncbi:MAG TPA: phytoene/squalene synthase family protein [Xanthobacteraceae bacterium]|jgi:phytoene synthase|nr:phytoene/squalene synthase family protein [Xanthobacteraceae bacterium]
MQQAFAHCEALVRAADRDRFLATLFAPRERRGALFALYAFNVEIARVREVVRDPVAGEIRLQWWSDVLAGDGRGEIEAHPVASALRASVARYGLPPERLQTTISARRFDLYDEPMATLADLEAYADGASSSLIALAAQILNGDGASDIDALSHHAGLAHAIAGLLKAFPFHAARGQLFVPLELLERHGADREDVRIGRATPQLRSALADLRDSARRHLRQAQDMARTVSPDAMPALLPVALAGATLARMERGDYDPFVPVEIAPWRRQWLIWRAARRPSRIFR